MSDTKDKMKIYPVSMPREVAVFPLPNIILFPEVEIPLYIFEPRYQQMIADCLSGNKYLAISLLKKGWEDSTEPVPSHEVIGVGFIRAVFENKDDTSYIVVRGISRAQITRYIQLEPYRIARIRPVPDEIQDPEELDRLARRLKNLFLKRLRWASEHPNVKPRLSKQMDNPITLSHLASSIIQTNPYLKQDLLETTNSNCRIKHLIELLKEEIYPPGNQN